MNYEPSNIPPHDSWTESERWVWAKLCQGEDANFNKEPDFKPTGPHESKWDERRELRPEFLTAITLNEPWRGAINCRGIRITGAWLRKELVFSNNELDHELALECCRFDAPVDLGGLRTDQTLSLANSVFNDVVGMEQVTTVKSVHLRNVSFGAKVSLCGAHIGGSLDMKGARFRGALRMDRIRVAGRLILSGAVFENEMSLASGKVGNPPEVVDARQHELRLFGVRVKADFQKR